MKAILYAQSPTNELIKFKEIETDGQTIWRIPLPSNVGLANAMVGHTPIFPVTTQEVSFQRIGTLPTGELMYVNIK